MTELISLLIHASFTPPHSLVIFYSVILNHTEDFKIDSCESPGMNSIMQTYVLRSSDHHTEFVPKEHVVSF